MSTFAIGQRVSVLSPFDRRMGAQPQHGVIVGAAIQTDPQGLEGTITVDLGNGCHEYCAPSWLEPVPLPLASICAWCDPDGTATKALQAQGRDVSHTICSTHRAEFEAGR